jgi:MOSC domain-containing protein YiiM
MRLASVNASTGERVRWRGQSIETAVFKKPVPGRVMVRRTNIDGDRQSDLAVHGGEFKAVYAYSAENYPWWTAQLQRELPFGMFGENLTIEGWDDEEVFVGDVLRVGGAMLEAVGPRLPCFKLGIRFSEAGMARRFLDSGRWGVYFKVAEEGEIGVGDEVRVVRRGLGAFPVAGLARLLLSPRRDPRVLRRVLSLPALAPPWREEFAVAEAAGRAAGLPDALC